MNTQRAARRTETMRSTAKPHRTSDRTKRIEVKQQSQSRARVETAAQLRAESELSGAKTELSGAELSEAELSILRKSRDDAINRS